MVQRSFPLVEGLEPDAPDELVFGVFDVLRNEARRAAFEGPDSEADEPVKFTVQLSPTMDQHVRSLAIAFGTSRRSLSSKLLTGAILESITALSREASSDIQHTDDLAFDAVWSEYLSALKETRKSAT